MEVINKIYTSTFKDSIQRKIHKSPSILSVYSEATRRHLTDILQPTELRAMKYVSLSKGSEHFYLFFHQASIKLDSHTKYRETNK